MWTEQESLQNAQAFGLLTTYKENLVYIGGRDPFTGVVFPLETQDPGHPGGAWKTWASLAGEISQYLTGCRRIDQERIFRNCFIAFFLLIS